MWATHPHLPDLDCLTPPTAHSSCQGLRPLTLPLVLIFSASGISEFIRSWHAYNHRLPYDYMQWIFPFASGTVKESLGLCYIYGDFALFHSFWLHVYTTNKAVTGSDMAMTLKIARLTVYLVSISTASKALLHFFIVTARAIILWHWKTTYVSTLQEWVTELFLLQCMEKMTNSIIWLLYEYMDHLDHLHGILDV